MEIDQLSPLDVVNAFPKEAREIGPRELKRWKAIRRVFWQEFIIPHLARVPKEERKIVAKILATHHSRELGIMNDNIKQLAMTINIANANSAKKATSRLPVQEARTYPLPQLCEQHGIELRQVGSKWVGRCPLHDDRHPSFVLFADNHFKCFGCGVNGDAIDLLQKVKGLDFAEAVRFLAGRC